MDNNRLLMIVLAFIVGYMASGMMKQMCGGRLVEGMTDEEFAKWWDATNTIPGMGWLDEAWAVWRAA